MVKHIYLTLAALLILAIAVSAAPAKVQYEVVKESDFPASRKAGEVQNSSADSDEEDDDEEEDVQQKKNDSTEDDDDDDDDVSFIRRRRETAQEPAKETAAAPVEAEAEPETPVEGVTTIPTTNAVSTTRKPVLVLIRDALKKVTTELPAEQVANNALQYFQLFEHFIQQTIEQVIDAADDDEEETPAAVTTAPATEEDKKPETAEKEPEKPTELVAVPEPVPVPAENAIKPAEPAVASNAV